VCGTNVEGNAKEILEMMAELAAEDGLRLPDPTPLEKLTIQRESDDPRI